MKGLVVEMLRTIARGLAAAVVVLSAAAGCGGGGDHDAPGSSR